MTGADSMSSTKVTEHRQSNPTGAVRSPTRMSLLQNAWLLPTVTTIGLLAVAEVALRSPMVDPAYLPTVTAVFDKIGDLARTATFWQAVADTVTQAAAGLGVAVAVAVPLGFLTGLSRLADDLTAYVVQLLRPVPAVALIPLFILVVGIGDNLAIALGAFAGIWPLLVQVRTGLAEVDPVAADTVRVFGLPWYARIRWLQVQGATPHILTGLRISATLALILAVTAELVAGSPGLGRDLALGQSAGDAVTMYAFVLVIGVLGVCLNLLLGLLEDRVLVWHPDRRRGGGR